jgi:hypothetical protein
MPINVNDLKADISAEKSKIKSQKYKYDAEYVREAIAEIYRAINNDWFDDWLYDSLKYNSIQSEDPPTILVNHSNFVISIIGRTSNDRYGNCAFSIAFNKTDLPLYVSIGYNLPKPENPIDLITFNKICEEFIDILCEYLDESELKYNITDGCEYYIVTIRL